jgi:uncharacterized delta-60 repeat protein
MFRFATVLTACLALIGAAPAVGTPGDLDRRFGDRGIVDERAPDGAAEIAELVPLPGGGVLAVARTYQGRLALLKYRADGSRDAPFGRRGRRIQSLSDTVGAIGSAARSPDGRILVGFLNFRQSGDWIVARFLPDGRVDRSFGADGLVTSDLEEAYRSTPRIVVRPDGRIVVAFQTETDVADVPHARVDLLALTRSGQPDVSFGNQGRATLERPDRDYTLRDVDLAPDGRLVTIGEEFGPEGTHTYIGRLAANGRAQRLVLLPHSPLSDDSVGVLANGDIAVAHVPSSPEDHSYVLRVFSPFGSAPVTHRVTFGNRWVVADELMVDRRGRIVIAGSVGLRLALARFLPSGRPDSSFGNGGAAVGPPRAPGRPGTMLTDVTSGPGDTILASGAPFAAIHDRVLIARFRGR